MSSVDWKKKLSSRKFWAAVAAWMTSLMTSFNIGDNVMARVSILIAGIGSLAVYILAEANVDAGNIVGETQGDYE
jgi:hypothetical protein